MMVAMKKKIMGMLYRVYRWGLFWGKVLALAFIALTKRVFGGSLGL